jgi:serine/threonine-protein kinase
LNLARPLLPAELMHLIVRHLYERMVEKGIYSSLSAEVQKSITLAYQRTSANVVRKLSQGVETGFEAGDFALHGVKLPFGPKLTLKRSRSIDQETSFAAYDDRSAEHDIIGISRALAAGVPMRCSIIKRVWNRLTDVSPKRVPLKLVFVFDEMDKLDELESTADATHSSTSSVEQMLSGLKSLFTTSGICFVFIAGKDLHEKWVRDLWRGDGVFESIFAYDKYLPCMWSDIDQICDRFAGDHSEMSSSNSLEMFRILKQYLRFMGRGMPRRFLRSFNGMVKWRDDKPEIPFENEELRRVTFFAHLNEALESNSDRLFGKISEDMDGTRQDRRRLGVYYVVDWILRKGKSDFSVAEVLTASHNLSARIAFAEEIASGAVEALIDGLLQADYIELVPRSLDDVIVGNPVAVLEKRYRLTSRRVAEIGGIASAPDDDVSNAGTDAESPKSTNALPRIGRFVTEEVIGKGGMGTVYKALDPLGQRHVALKVMHEASPENRDRFLREIRILENLRHDNIVRFLESGEGNSLLYFAMDLVEGSDLRLILKNLGRLSPETALAILLPIGRAIGFANGHGYMRLDLKPANVQVTFAGQVFLLDLGIAKGIDSTQSLTQTGIIVGTPTYMSPEQFRDAPIDARADIYAYGVMLYEALTGTPPFSGDVLEVCIKHMKEDAKRPCELVPEIPAWLDELVMKCLKKDPSDRFQTMEDLLNEANSNTRISISSAEMGSIAQKARQKSRNLEDSRNARTLQGPGGFTALLQNLSSYSSVGTAANTGKFKVPDINTGANALSPARKPYLSYGEPDQTLIFSKTLAGSARTRIGSALDNDIVLQKEDVSRYHAQIESIEGTYLLVDLNSSKGTYMNGERLLRPQKLSPRDRFRISTTQFTFVA